MVVHDASVLRLFQSRRCSLGTRKLEVIKGDRLSKTESSPTLSHPSVFESVLSQDSVDTTQPNLEIDRTLRRLRKVRSTCSSFNINSNCNFGLSDFQEPKPMENNERTLKELAMPDVVYQPWCIQYPQLEPAQSYELKSGLIHLLPKFHGLAGEDPYKHLKEFHVVCSTMRLQGIPKDYIKMKAFPFSLDGTAKDWLYLQLVLFNTSGDMIFAAMVIVLIFSIGM
ncbi:hypothetical protein CR513_28778, partial [Mucuna pruriens]